MLQRRFRGVPGPALIGMSSSLSKPAQFGARRAGVLLASGLLLSLLQGCGGKTANRTPSNPGPAGPSEDAAVRDGLSRFSLAGPLGRFLDADRDVLQRDAEEVAFIDDRPGNCAAAEALGIHAIQYQDESQCAQALERLGLGSGVRT